MAIDIWERQLDLLNLKFLRVRKDLNELLDIYESPACVENEELREQTAHLLMHVRLKVDEYEKEIKAIKARKDLTS